MQFMITLPFIYLLYFIASKNVVQNKASYYCTAAADFHLCLRDGSKKWEVQRHQKLKNVCDLHTLKLA